MVVSSHLTHWNNLKKSVQALNEARTDFLSFYSLNRNRPARTIIRDRKANALTNEF